MMKKLDKDSKISKPLITNRAIKNLPLRFWYYKLIGAPLPTSDVPNQTIGKAIGLAVFAADALSSVAYAPEETLVILAAAGTSGFTYAFPIAVAVTILLVIVTISYQQTIHAYPGGGGAYIVARDNLGEVAAQTAGAALLTDYTLLAAVAVSSGAAQIVSAFPDLLPYRVPMAIGLILFIMLANLRGVKESGAFFAIPTYFFLVMTFLMVGVGFFRYLTGSLGILVDPPEIHLVDTLQPVSLFLILRAFSSGTTALTGVECISNGVTAFKEPRSHNAGVTMIWMSAILGVLFLGITFLLRDIGAVPSQTETVISQLARTVFNGQGLLYLAAISGTTIILVLATNTAFADFPRLAALQAGDGFLPRQLTMRGNRLVFSKGILTLGVVASLLVFLFNASVTALVPLWAIGVFLSFTLSQTGMARRWWRIGHLAQGQEVRQRGSTLSYQSGWKLKMVVNGFGAIVTAVVTVIFAATKFKEGAWIVVLLIPGMVTLFFSIHHHYRTVQRELSLHGLPPSLKPVRPARVVIPLSGVHRGLVKAVSFAMSITSEISAVYIEIEPGTGEKVRKEFQMWWPDLSFIIVPSPYRSVIGPLLNFLEEYDSECNDGQAAVVVLPEFVPGSWWQGLLHNQTAWLLKAAILYDHHKHGRERIIINIPFLLR